jgi:hypothetical protein
LHLARENPKPGRSIRTPHAKLCLQDHIDRLFGGVFGGLIRMRPAPHVDPGTIAIN